MNPVQTLPVWLRRTLWTIYHEWLSRDHVYRYWMELRRSQWYIPERLVDIAHRRLAVIIDYAVSQVPYYRALANDGQIKVGKGMTPIESLRTFPLLDKSIIRSRASDLLCKSIPASQVKKSSTSGSTGESLYFFLNLVNGAWRYAGKMRHTEWCGVSPFERHATLWGARFDTPAHTLLGDRLRLALRPLLFLSSYELDEYTMGEYLRQLKAFRPVLLTSYPTPLARFAEFYQSKGENFPTLKAIICSAEQLFDHQRKNISEVLQVPVFNRYGCREFADIAHECDIHRGMHVDIERLWVEVLREDGSPCAPGELGEIVVTDLTNKAMPFIRYRIGDLGAWASSPCPCGRGLPLLEYVEGRAFDLIKTSSGKEISGTFWTLLGRYVSGRIDALQVRQTRIDMIDLLLVMRDGQPLKSEEEKLLRQKIAETAEGLEVAIEYVESIPETLSGKRRFIISSIN